ncbi:MAG: toprim domain-containing protein, partial [Chloroflexota bacterium]
MTVDIVELKRLNRIEDVVDEFEEFRLDRRGRGNQWRAADHDSFVVTVDKQLYFWNSKGRGGDVISFLEQEQGMTFRGALEWMARRAGITLHMDETEARRLAAKRQRADVLTTVMEFLQGKLAASAAAMAYAEGRGWTRETVTAARCGFWDGDKRGLAKHLQMHEIDVGQDAVQAVMGMPAGLFVYGHWRGNTCEYVSGRSIEGKRHFNPRSKLMGERQPYWNHKVAYMDTHVVVVEGQADALTLAQWDIPAVALAGVSANEELIGKLRKFMKVYVALDADQAGRGNAADLAAKLGPLTRIVSWPERGELEQELEGEEERPIKDANDWLQAGGTAEACRELLGTADNYAIWLCRRVAAAAPMEREGAMDRAVAAVAQLP